MPQIAEPILPLEHRMMLRLLARWMTMRRAEGREESIHVSELHAACDKIQLSLHFDHIEHLIEQGWLREDDDHLSFTDEDHRHRALELRKE